MAATFIEVRHRKGCPAQSKGVPKREPRRCSCAPSVRVQVNRVWQPDLAGELPLGWGKRDLNELEAKARRRAVDHDSGRRLVTAGTAPTVRELGEELLAEVRRGQALGDYAMNTVKTYQSLWSALVEPAFGDYRVTALTPEAVADVRAKWAGEGRSRSYIIGATSLLSMILADKAIPRWLDSNPVTRSGRRKRGAHRMLKARKPRQTRALDTRFVFELLDAAIAKNELLHDMILCGVATGMRQRELAGLRVDCVHLRERRIEVVGQLVGPTLYEPLKSISSERVTVICDPLAERLQKRLQHAREYVFETPTTTDGLPWSPRQQGSLLTDLWDEVGPRAKGESWHALRHTFASVLDRHRIRPLVIDAVMGHKNQGVAFRYRHVLDDELNVVLAALNAEFDRTPPDVVRLDDRRRRSA